MEFKKGKGERMTDNPFLEEEKEEKYIPEYIPEKPFQEETLTQKQHDKNMKGIKECLDNLKKVKGKRYE